MRQSKTNQRFSILFLLILTGFFLLFMVNGESQYMWETIVLFSGTLVMLVVEHRKGLVVRSTIRGLVFLTILIHLTGNHRNLYDTSEVFDDLLHLFGCFAFTLYAYNLLEKALIPYHFSPYLLFLLVFSVGVSLGTLFEILEFGVDRMWGTDMQRGLIDTNLDLLFDTLGAFLAGLISIPLYQKKTG